MLWFGPVPSPGEAIGETVGAPARSEATLGSLIAEAAGRLTDAQLLSWPPDVFAITAWVLERTEAFRLVVSPPAGKHWPPGDARTWTEEVARTSAHWSAHAGGRAPEPPDTVIRLWETIGEHAPAPLARMVRGRPWSACTALLTLHAIADEACAGVGTATDAAFGPGCEFRGRAREHLAEFGSLSRIPTDKVRVLPKGRLADGGITLRSLSRHVGASFSPVELLWTKVPKGPRTVSPETEHSTILLVPWPFSVDSDDFRPVKGPLSNMDPSAFQFFEFKPQEPFDLDLLHDILHAAARATRRIDAVVMPECALDTDEVAQVEGLLADHGIPMLVSGVRHAAQSADRLGENLAQLSVHTRGGWRCYQQAKHHRWMLDGRQVRRYGLEESLDPEVGWWEAIQIPPRSIQIIEMGEGMTVVPLVCEDLARYDGSTDLLRAFGPALVVTLLLDGPQLTSRWTSRNAGVLADDPGSTVLTLTSLDMALRSVPPGGSPSRVVALWNDRQYGVRELELGDESHALLLHTRLVGRGGWTADGRRHASNADLVLAHVTEISAVPPGEFDDEVSRPFPKVRSLEGLTHVDLTKLTGWIESLVEAAAVGSRADVDGVLRSFRPTAAWRADFGLVPPAGNLALALESLGWSMAIHANERADLLEAARASATDLRSRVVAPLPLTGRTVAAAMGQRIASLRQPRSRRSTS